MRRAGCCVTLWRKKKQKKRYIPRLVCRRSPLLGERKSESPGQTGTGRHARDANGQDNDALSPTAKTQVPTPQISRVTQHTRNLVKARVRDPLHAGGSGHARRRGGSSGATEGAAGDVVGHEGVQH
eukprot:5964041-Prymnesium_polylepis.2